MKIEKAIEIKEDYHERFEKGMLSWEREADKMSIEALKRIYSQYDPDHQMMRIPLPGETFD